MTTPVESRTTPATARTAARPTLETYTRAPSLDDVRSGSAELARGHRGESVRALQKLLNACGAEPPLVEDGLFGPATELALMGAKSRAPAFASEDVRRLGVADRGAFEGLTRYRDTRAREGDGVGAGRPDTVVPSAPAFGAPRPEGTVPAGQLARDDEARRRTPATPATPATTPATPSTPATATTPATPYIPSGLTSGAPPGYQTIRGAVPPGVVAKARTLLHHDYGTEIPFELDGKRYVARLERHYHPPGYVGGPNGWHKGVSVYVEK